MRFRTVLLIGLVLLVCSPFGRGQDLSGQVAEANRLYREGKFQEALDLYLEALRARPELPQLHFNLGDALYKSQDFEKALDSFRESLSQASPDLQADSWFNLGNALFQQGDLEKSLEAYKESLKLNPSDPDAKHNLEFVLKQMQEQQQQKQNQDQQNQDQQNQDQQQEQDSQDSSDQSNPEQQEKQEDQQRQQEQEQKEQQQDQQQNQQEDQQKEDQQPQSSEQESPSGEEPQQAPGDIADKQMSLEQVQRLLDALKEDPEQFLKRKIVKPARVRVKKDW